MANTTHLDILDRLDVAPTENTPLERRHFLEGMDLLSQGQLEQASKKFRRAAREASSPWDALARLALGRCAQSQGKTGVATRAFKQVADDAHAPSSSRHFALLSLALLEQEQGNIQHAHDLLEQAQTFAP